MARTQARTQTPPSSTPAPPPQRLSKPERVNFIVDVMLRGDYVNGQTPRMLAEMWGLSKSCVEKDAAEASRHIRRAAGDPEDMRARLVAQLQGIIADAQQRYQPKAAVAGIHEIGELLGLHARTLAVTGPDGAPLLPGVVVLPPEEDGPEGKPVAEQGDDSGGS